MSSMNAIQRGDTWNSLRVFFTLFAFLFFALGSYAVSDPARMRVDVQGVPTEPVWVGQKVSLNVRVLIAERPVGPIQFSVPEAEGGVLLRLQESPFYGSETVDGISFTTWNYTFLFYPHRAGETQIPPLIARVTLGEKGAAPLQAGTSAIELTAKLPRGAEGLRTLVATRELTVTESWSPEPPFEAKVGDAFTRSITLEAPDVLAMGFSTASFSASETIRVYPKAPIARDVIHRGDLTGYRTETIVYICQAEGPANIPALVYPWLKLGDDTLQAIELEGHSFEVLPNPAIANKIAKENVDLHSHFILFLTLTILVVLGFLAWWLGPRIGLRLRTWWAKRQTAEPAVFRRLVTALKEGHLRSYHAESRRWLESLPVRCPPSLSLLVEQSGEVKLASTLREWLGMAYGPKPSQKLKSEELVPALNVLRAKLLAPDKKAKALSTLNGAATRTAFHVTR